MSHSYKHTPMFTDGRNGRKPQKGFANSKVRKCQNEDIPIHKRAWYKRVSETWDIHDYKSRWTEAEAIIWLTALWYDEEAIQKSRQLPIEQGYYHKRYKTLNNYIQNYWHKKFKRK